MVRSTRILQLSTLLVLGYAIPALAQDSSETPAADSATTEPGADPTIVPAADEGVSATPVALKPNLNVAMYGVAARFRWVTVPSWFLGLFTKENVPLSSYAWAVEGYRRKHDKDDPNRTWELSVAVGYQKMGPADGYWLGKNKDPAADADLVQFRDFSLITFDAAFISRQYFGRYFGIHYGAGLGLAIVRGKMLRTSAQYDPTTGQYQVATPGGTANQNTGWGTGQQICNPSAKCNEGLLNQSQTGPDNAPYDAHRFQEQSVPGAIPIINLLVGLDFPIPDAKGLEFRIDAGFYNAFFLGGTAGWVF